MAYRLQPKRPKPVEVQVPAQKTSEVPAIKVLFKNSSKTLVQKPKEKSEKKKQKLFYFIAEDVVKHPVQLLDFVRWIAVPREIRSPKTQGEYSKISNINPDTLSKYKNIARFWDEVARYRTSLFRKWTSDVYYGLVKRAKGGNAREVELFAKLFESFSEKIRVQDEPPRRELDEKEKKQIADALTNIGLASIIKMNKFEEDEEDEPEING